VVPFSGVAKWSPWQGWFGRGEGEAERGRTGAFGDAHVIEARQLSLNHQTSFTDFLPSSFGDNLGLWLKTSPGPHDGQIKKGEASNGVNVPLCGPYSVLMTPALKILSDA